MIPTHDLEPGSSDIFTSGPDADWPDLVDYGVCEFTPSGWAVRTRRVVGGFMEVTLVTPGGSLVSQSVLPT